MSRRNRIRFDDPEAVILFGSPGREDGNAFSDVDFLVVIGTDRDTKDLSEEMIPRCSMAQ